MRFWLWLTTGMVTRQWVAIHRKHHVYSDRPGDPHSPLVFGIWRVFFTGVSLYISEAKNRDTIDRYGLGTPDDWIERNLYTPCPYHGVSILLLINLAMFGPWGVLIWAVQMGWIPFHAAGVINGLGHWIGYKNGPTKDHSRNLIPWGIWIGGEELHSNHHEDPSSAKLSRRWFEFDIGWAYLKLFEALRLAKIRY
jgi:stearoyl-CoA desaturase (delta-9 desaturase)